MSNKYLIVSKEILPDYFDKVIEARELLEQGKVKNISEAVKKVGISRSTYYKYKDFVFSPSAESHGKRALISVVLEHTQGSLSNVLYYISSINGNILTINQNIPMNNSATVIIFMEILHMAISIEEAIDEINKLANVINCKLMSIE